jgi:hypothetical protein
LADASPAAWLSPRSTRVYHKMKTRKMQFEEGRFLMWVLSRLREVLEAQALVAMAPLMPAQVRHAGMRPEGQG